MLENGYPEAITSLPEGTWDSFGKALSIIDTLTADLEAEQKKAAHTPHTMGGDRQWRPAPTEHRIETGAVRFGDDWPGLFIRGDNAAGLLSAIQAALTAGHLVSESGQWMMLWAWILDLKRMISEDVFQQPASQPGADHD